MGWVFPSVRLSLTPLLQRVQNNMFKGSKGNQPERQLAALTKRAALYTSLYTEDFEAEFT
jgi:hypothetical protein